MRPVISRLARVATSFLIATSAEAASDTTSPPTAPLRDGYPAAETGLIYKDVLTNVVIYVETDGRHVVAICPDGKLLWRKDPFIDGGLQPYRMARPTISSIGPARGVEPAVGPVSKFFAIQFTSSQMGVMEIATGRFTFQGQN